MYDLITIGSAVKDLILITDRGKIFKTPKDNLAPEWFGLELGEKICVSEVTENLGGVASDIAIGTKKLGLTSTLISTLGSDYKWILRELKKYGIKTSYISLEKDRQTTSVIIVDKKTGERVILYNRSSGTIALDKIDKIKTKWLSVSSLTGKWTQQAEKILGYLEKNKTELILAPSTSQIKNDFVDLKKLLNSSKILIINRNEALEIASKVRSKKTDIKSLITMLRGMGPRIVCVTDGIKGAFVSDKEKILHCPIIKVKTVDMTGAGDAFASGFIGFFLKGESLEDSLRAGIINSASVVQLPGTTKGLLKKKDIMKMFGKLRVKMI
jgi:pseudouridine kinase